MTHGHPWIQEIPVRHVYSTRDRHVNQTGQPSQHHSDYDNDSQQSIESSPPPWTVHRDVNSRDFLERRHSARSDKVIHDRPDRSRQTRGTWRSPDRHSNYTLVLKSSPKQVKKPVPVYHNNSATLGKDSYIKPCESSTSVATITPHASWLPNERPVKRSVSNAEPLVRQKSIFPFPNPERAFRSVRQPLTQIEPQNQWENYQNQAAPNQNWYDYGTGKMHRRHQAKINMENNIDPKKWQQFISPVATSTAKAKPSKMVQESFLWKDDDDQSGYYSNYPSVRKVTGTGSQHFVSKPPESMIYHGHASPLPVKQSSEHRPSTGTLRNKRGEGIPFTKKTGKESQDYFLKLMKPTAEQSVNIPVHVYQRYTQPIAEHLDQHLVPPPKPPLAPQQSTRGPSEYETSKHIHMNGISHKSPEHEDKVIYTEVIPQTVTRSDKDTFKNKAMRTRSHSPVIYTEVIPSRRDEPKAAPRQMASENRQPKQQVNNNRASMTFGDDLSISPSEEVFAIQRQPSLSKQHNPKQNYKFNEVTNPSSKAPSEVSISLAMPHLQWRKNRHDINNNYSRPTYKQKDSEIKPFPTDANLDQMLSDTGSSKKSIKSALKQPSHNPFGTNDMKTMRRSPKRVTIKENSSGRTTPNSIIHTSYKTNPACGFTRAPIHRPHVNSIINPHQRFKVVNRNIVMLS